MEFYGIAKVATMGLGVKGLLDDLGVEAKPQVNTDSSAAESIAPRRGVGRVRHIEVWELWAQDRVAKRRTFGREGERRGKRCGRLREDRQKMEQYVAACSMVRRSGRHEFCPRLGDGK